MSEERGRGWVIGHVSAIPVVLSPGWVVAALLLTGLLLPFARRLASGQGPVAVWTLAFAAVALLFASTFLHEVAHAVVARRFDMPVHRIALTLIGGHTVLGDRAPSPKASALVAAAGPAVNIVLGAVAWLGWAATSRQGALPALVFAFAFTNGFVAVLNLLPGHPLDGGRVLEAAVWGLTGRRATGTRAAAWAGRFLAVGMAAWSLWPPLSTQDLARVAWGILIAAFVWSGASQSLRTAGFEEAADALDLAALTRPAVALASDAPVAELDSIPPGFAVVLVDDGAPVGFADQDAAVLVPAGQRVSTALVSVATPLPPEARVEAGLLGREAVDAIREAAARSPMVVAIGPDGAIVGIVSVTDVVRALRLPGRK